MRRHSCRAVVASQAPSRSGSSIRSRFSTRRSQVVWVDVRGVGVEKPVGARRGPDQAREAVDDRAPGALVAVAGGADRASRLVDGLSRHQPRRRWGRVHAAGSREGRVDALDAPAATSCSPGSIGTLVRDCRRHELGDRRRDLRGRERRAVPARPAAEVLDRRSSGSPSTGPSQSMNVETTSSPRVQQSHHSPQLENHARACRGGWSTRRRSRRAAPPASTGADSSLPAGATTATPVRGASGPVSTCIAARTGATGSRRASGTRSRTGSRRCRACVQHRVRDRNLGLEQRLAARRGSRRAMRTS